MPKQDVRGDRSDPIANPTKTTPATPDLMNSSSASTGDDSAVPQAARSEDASFTPFPAFDFVAGFLDNRPLQIAVRLFYIPISSYGAYKLIQEQPQSIFYGWRAWLITLGFVLNGIIALLSSNAELYVAWAFIRTTTNRTYLLAGYEKYPQQTHRLAGIAICAYVYNAIFSFSWSKLSTTALVVSVFLVASDTPSGRALLWTRERRDKTALVLGFAILTFVGGWRVYRWPVLLAAYLDTVALLSTEIHPTADKIALHQFWLACAALPSVVIVSAYRPEGVPWYSTLMLLGIMLAALRSPTATSDMVTVRQGSIVALTALLELYARGFTYSFLLQAIGLLIYVVNVAA